MNNPVKSYLTRARSKAKEAWRGLCIDLADKDDTVWLFGNGRSGGTWVSSLINHKGDYRYLFEPLHPLLIDEVQSYPLFPYLRPSTQDSKLHRFYSNVFNGKVQDKRITHYAYNRRIIYRRRLVKDIFANLCAAWVAEHFGSTRKLFLMRHPCAVALSKSKLKHWEWMEEPIQFLQRDQLLSDFLAPFEQTIQAAETYFEKQVVVWCITNLIPLSQLNLADVHILFYEELVAEPGRHALKLYRYLGHGHPESEAAEVIKTASTPSPTSREEEYKSSQDRLEAWKKDLQTSQVETATEILQRFGLAEIYNDSLMPNREKLFEQFGAT